MSADIIYRNGIIWNPAYPGVSALAVRDGRIVALGSEAEEMRASRTEIVDLDGAVLLPALGDGHAHPVFGALERTGPPISDAESVTDIVEAVRGHARANPELDWIVGSAYDPILAPEGRFDARWLDEAVPDRPVVLRAADYHSLWCNSLALARAGITAATPDPPIGYIARRPDGQPLGTLYEWHACDLVLRLVPHRTPGELRAAVRHAATLYEDAGFNWVQDAWIDPDDGIFDAYLHEAPQLPVRVGLALRADPGHWRQQRAVFADCRRTAETTGGDRLTARTVKFFADGIVESRTATLLTPYTDAPHTCGLPVWEPTALAEAVTAFDHDGFQIHIHAIGDAAVRAALNAIEHAIQRNPSRDRRHVIAHAQLVHPVDLPRFATLGVIANCQPLWAQLDDAQHRLTLPRLGPDRGDLQYPLHGLLATGARLSFGSDWPVSSYEPLEGIRTAINRQTDDGQPPGGWLPDQRITVDQAITAYTEGCAYQAFAEHDRGTLNPGKRAELALLKGAKTNTDGSLDVTPAATLRMPETSSTQVK